MFYSPFLLLLTDGVLLAVPVFEVAVVATAGSRFFLSSAGSLAMTLVF